MFRKVLGGLFGVKENNKSASSTSSSNGSGSELSQSPLLFSNIHGENIEVCHGGAYAKRTRSFCHGVIFSNRPVKVHEKVCIKVKGVSSNWNGVLRFGFTNHSPNSFRLTLPKVACPDITSKPGSWAKALRDSLVVEEAVIQYYVTATGEVYFEINGRDQGLFFNGVDTSKKLWCLIDIYGNTTAIEFVDLQSYNGISTLLTQPPPHAPDPTNSSPPALRHFLLATRTELYFHRTCGRNMSLNSQATICWQLTPGKRGAYAFTSRPIKIEETIVFQFQKGTVANSMTSKVGVGLTSCNPSYLSMDELPASPLALLDRPEYWVLIENGLKGVAEYDEFGITILHSGAVNVSRNGCPPVLLLHVDTSVPLWLFLDLFGPHKLFMAGSVTTTPQPSLGSSRNSQQQLPQEVPSSLSLLKSIKQRPRFPKPDKTEEVKSVKCEKPNFDSPSDCVVCCERVIDSVFYTCGHMCMCFTCATNYWKEKKSECCPICRAIIIDIIKIYAT